MLSTATLPDRQRESQIERNPSYIPGSYVWDHGEFYFSQPENVGSFYSENNYSAYPEKDYTTYMYNENKPAEPENHYQAVYHLNYPARPAGAYLRLQSSLPGWQEFYKTLKCKSPYNTSFQTSKSSSKYKVKTMSIIGNSRAQDRKIGRRNQL